MERFLIPTSLPPDIKKWEPMKNSIAKVIIGFVTFSTFCVACSPLFFMDNSSSSKPAKGKYFNNKDSSTLYTRSDYKKPEKTSYSKRSYGRVIYLGEPIDGVMDFN